MASHTLHVNGRRRTVDAPADMPLLWALRDRLGLTGTKYGCGIAQCGACTVHLDGVATRSCAVTVADAAGARITTIEGLAGRRRHPLQQAWIEHEVPQCGYCQSGQIMAAAALLATDPSPDDAAIDAGMRGNVCRCGTYARIRTAIRAAAAASYPGSYSYSGGPGEARGRKRGGASGGEG